MRVSARPSYVAPDSCIRHDFGPTRWPRTVRGGSSRRSQESSVAARPSDHETHESTKATKANKGFRATKPDEGFRAFRGFVLFVPSSLIGEPQTWASSRRTRAS